MNTAATRLCFAAVAGFAGVVALVAANSFDPNGADLQALHPPRPPPAAPQAPFVLSDLSDFDATVERPLFMRGRRPPGGLAAVRPSAGPAKPPPPSAPHLTLAGIAIFGRSRLALVQVEGAKDLASVGEGGQVAGWTVVQVLPDRIRLSRGSEAFEAALREFKKAN